ncbi:MAG TPA: DUF2125 domain-containing protein, partial [Aestuariivirga sp.]|nr:DUF2125 domain-containing protein [Aestuariivirga sp.]
SGTLTREQVLNIAHLQMSREPVKLWGKGAVRLDAAHRIAGVVELHTNDLNGVLSLLRSVLPISEEDRAVLATVFGLFAPGTPIPLRAREGVLYLGPLKLGELAPVY